MNHRSQHAVAAPHRAWAIVVLGLLLVMAALRPPSAVAARLHVVYAIDVRAERVGQDLNRSSFLNAALGMSIPAANLEFYPIDTDDLSEVVILNAVRRVPVGPDDALMFVYVGHGALDRTGDTYMTPSASTGRVITAMGMLRELHARRPRLAVVVFDCCNREKAPRSSLLPAPGYYPPEVITPLCDTLFFRQRGSVVLVSSSPGEYAFVRASRDSDLKVEPPVPAGPLFLNALSATLARYQKSRLNWPTFLDQTQTQLDEYFRVLTGPQRRMVLDDGTVVQQNRQTIHVRYPK